MKNGKYIPNAVVFSKGDFIPKTCDIYKFNLTKEQKLKHFKKHFKEDYDFLGETPEEVESSEGYTSHDFYLVKCKENLRRDLEEGKIQFLLKWEGYADSGYEEISNLDNWANIVEDYFEENVLGDLAVSSENRRNQIWFIDNSDIFEEEEEEE